MGAREARTALVVGADGAGGGAALTLAAGGAARLVLADDARVGAADLAAGAAFRHGDLGAPRAQAAARVLAQLFPALAIDVAPAPDDAAAAALVAAADVVVDASNRFSTMFALNDAAVARGVPLVHAGVAGLTAQVLSVVPGTTGCLRCLFEAAPPGAPPVSPVPAPLAALAGALLGAEALRLLAGLPGALGGLVLGYEARSGRGRTVPLRPRAGCPACAAAPRGRTGEAA